MKLQIHSQASCGKEELRALLIDAAEQLAGPGCKVLEPKLPWDGHPVLLADAELHPVVVSFDTESEQAVLHNGLMAVEKLASALAWLNQVYEILQQRQQPPRLVIVSPQPPPGATTVLAACPMLRIFRFKLLRVNDETGLWLEPLAEQAANRTDSPEPAEVDPSTPVAKLKPVVEDQLPPLSNEEVAYFQQL